MFGVILDAEYFMGWVVEPLEDGSYYVYDRKDTSRPKGFRVLGDRGDAFRFIWSKLEREAG